MRFVVRMTAATVLPVLMATGTGCRRPAEPLADEHPGIDPKPSGWALWDNVRLPDPERGVIDLSRPDSLGRGFEPQPEQDLVYEAAMRGEAWAQTKLGKSYVASPDDAVRMERGMDLLRSAAEQDYAEALFELAKMALAGRGMDRSPSTAFDQMKRAAELGLPDAEYELASMYSDGRGTNKDPVAALQWAQKAAANSHPKATSAVGMIMLQSEDPSKQAEGLAMLKRAVEAGSTDAALTLATAYARGRRGLSKDESAAEALLKKQAEDGDAECQFALASLYQFGETFAARREEAQVWLQRAADQGHPQALEVLRSESDKR